MGFNTVLVILNDSVHMGEKDSKIGGRILNAVRGWHGRDRDPLSCHISYRSEGGGAGSYGQVISQAHADYEQVVVVGGNTGAPIGHCNALGWAALDQCADALRRHGWTVKPPVKKRKKAA